MPRQGDRRRVATSFNSMVLDLNSILLSDIG